jgi:hypothetical protein
MSIKNAELSRFFFLRKKGLKNYAATRDHDAVPVTSGEANDLPCTNACINFFSLPGAFSIIRLTQCQLKMPDFSLSSFFLFKKKGLKNYAAIREYYAASATPGEANDLLCTNACIDLCSLP